ncbi:MAG: hypothetical protein LBS96_05330 [Oscillospiraceae bacterium]|nr:hypothetical protein [Oscillospiraceae bacterium]
MNTFEFETDPPEEVAAEEQEQEQAEVAAEATETETETEEAEAPEAPEATEAVAEETEAPEAEPPAPAKKGKGKWIAILGGALVVVVAVVLAAVFTFAGGKPQSTAEKSLLAAAKMDIIEVCKIGGVDFQKMLEAEYGEEAIQSVGYDNVLGLINLQAQKELAAKYGKNITVQVEITDTEKLKKAERETWLRENDPHSSAMDTYLLYDWSAVTQVAKIAAKVSISGDLLEEASDTTIYVIRAGFTWYCLPSDALLPSF